MENTDINTNSAKISRILLNTQMIADELIDKQWTFLLNSKDRTPSIHSFELYAGQSGFRDGVIYILPRGRAKGFPVDRYTYITSENIFGTAPHIRNADRTDQELINALIDIFDRYHQMEADINSVLVCNGTLSDLCRVGIRYFKNPVYIHDSMFTVIALPEYKEGMLQFERFEDGNIHVPLWLINEFKFDEAYHETLTKREAGIWGKDQFPRNMRSLYVNIWDGNHYNGRLLINELDSPLKPGQFRMAEMFGEYVKIIMHRDQQPQKHYTDYEDTVKLLISGQTPSSRDVRAILDILSWEEEDSYLCLKIRSQNQALPIRSDSALRSQLTVTFPGSFEFFHEQSLCMIINYTKDSRDVEEIKSAMASVVRDSYMYCGISYPIRGLYNIKTGFAQADITLSHIEDTKDRWLMLFGECALDYMISKATQDMPAVSLAAPVLIKLRTIDRQKNTDYYNTLRTFLKNERSIPKTSEELIIHRTTLQYRLEKIQELIKLNLENEDVRLYLKMSFKIMDMVNKEAV